ncbi:MAG TPA: lipid droplet-associated protein [Mycobacterium sp.]|nr:lipid droplet-associated protein [Mycobacterium sp.]
MATAPYGIRLLVGAATVAIEETKKLPQTILTYPMTLASQAAHIVMLWQQSLAELVNKGDSTLEALFPPKDELPEWATFDEDLDGTDDSGNDESGWLAGEPDGFQRTEGRFALYSSGDTGRGDSETNTTPVPNPARRAMTAPDIVTELDYGALTLAQLRARLSSLSVDDLTALLGYEEATRARAPFQTLLANRITRESPK